MTILALVSSGTRGLHIYYLTGNSWSSSRWSRG